MGHYQTLEQSEKVKSSNGIQQQSIMIDTSSIMRDVLFAHNLIFSYIWRELETMKRGEDELIIDIIYMQSTVLSLGDQSFLLDGLWKKEHLQEV